MNDNSLQNFMEKLVIIMLTSENAKEVRREDGRIGRRTETMCESVCLIYPQSLRCHNRSLTSQSKRNSIEIETRICGVIQALAATRILEKVGDWFPNTHLPPTRTEFHSWRVAPGFSHVGIVPDDAASRVFSGISRFPRPCNSALLRTHPALPSSALKTLMLRAAQNSSLTHSFSLSLVYSGSTAEWNGWAWYESSWMIMVFRLAIGDFSSPPPLIADPPEMMLVRGMGEVIAIGFILGRPYHSFACVLQRAKEFQASNCRRLDFRTYERRLAAKTFLRRRDVFHRSDLILIILIASHHSKPGSIPGLVTPRFSQVGIVPENAADRRVFSGIFRFSRPCIPAPLHSHLISPSSALKTSLLRAAHISPLNLVVDSNQRESLTLGLINSNRERCFYGKLQPFERLLANPWESWESSGCLPAGRLLDR
ncbi:hypothetical protein PR048_015645 [Dryococelus australis]|uniref:Uncharacterized protein n=1 Tax=Dryococelus australis TaxID=614101 RepID=A0ABQ9HI24_9NEOP|nr:hypothetical protein PR048_015645 [Dryococelus australis]